MANKHMKWCSISLVIEEKQNKITMRCYSTPIRMAKMNKEYGNTKCWPFVCNVESL